MQQKITPNLWFDTEAEEAADFYTSVFKDSRIVTKTHYTEGAPREAGMVMTVEWELNGQRFVGINGGPQFEFDEAVSFADRPARTRTRSTTTGRSSSRAAAQRASAAGSRTSSACPGRSSPPGLKRSSPTRTRSAPSAR